MIRKLSFKAYESCFQYSYISDRGEENDNWTRFWGGYTWLSDPDLGEMEVPEPPLVHQAGPEELDLFLESAAHNDSETANETEYNPDEAPTLSSLIGAWSGTYEYQRGMQSDGLVGLSITEQRANGEIEGSGMDGLGAFTIAGTITGNKVNFIKSYATADLDWKYTGILDSEMTEVVGHWEPPDTEEEVAPSSATSRSSFFSRPREGIDGNGAEDHGSPEQVPTLEGPSRSSGKENEEEAVGDEESVSNAGYPLSGTQKGAAEVLIQRVSFSLVRRPVDYFLYRPSDAESNDSRPKVLWQMVRNAARRWYCSHHLIWDTLRERRDRRNRYIQLLLKREEVGMLCNPDEAAEWVKITRETHPNDLRLWRAIMHYKQKRRIPQSYVSPIPHLQLPDEPTDEPDCRASCDNCGNIVRGSRLMCSDCTVGGWSNSIDLCANCWSSDCSRESDHKNHISTHMLIQFRRPVPRMEYYDRFGLAKRVVEASTKNLRQLELSCAICAEAIPEKPYWCCLVCDGTFSTSYCSPAR